MWHLRKWLPKWGRQQNLAGTLTIYALWLICQWEFQERLTGVQKGVDNDHPAQISGNRSDSDEGVIFRGFALVDNTGIATSGRYLKMRIEANRNMGSNSIRPGGAEEKDQATSTGLFNTGRVESMKQTIGRGVIVLVHQADCFEALHHQAGAVEPRGVITAPEVRGSEI